MTEKHIRHMYATPLTVSSSARSASLFRAVFCVAVCVVSYGPALFAAEAADSAWRNFQHARGDTPLIGVNADHERANSAWRPIPEPGAGEVDRDRFQLGSDLFHEGRLSSGNSVACVTCHAGALSGADRRPVSIGVGGARGTMNALSVFNAGYNFRKFWNGRAVTLEDQSLEPIRNPVEMAHTLDAVQEMLRSDEEYADQFAEVYPDGVTINNMTDAIAHFQRIQFVRLDTPFQRFLKGEEEALDEQERRGMRQFEEVGCTGCHNGINLGGNSYQKLGSAIPYYGDERQARANEEDVMDRSGRERDRHVFRVPGLHGVATTSPYFHDGSVATLEEAIEEMAEHQLGRELDPQDREDIEAFLRSLGGYFTAGHSVEEAAGESSEAVSEQANRASAGSHEQAYRDAIRALEEAGRQLLPEMQRIHAGEVAHYDFLQLQHLEMIRHARALHHPPSSMGEPQRSALIEAAQALREEVNDLEWVIADFLRAEAMIRVFAAHQEASAGRAVPDGVDDPGDRLRDYRERAGELMAVMEESGPERFSAVIRDALP
ncbi:MAG: cytochrome c peroxidase [Pseudohongiellaceae bacterium]